MDEKLQPSYQIVTFKDTSDPMGKPVGDLVSSVWVRKDVGGYICFYPPAPYKNIQNLVKNHTVPAVSWQKFDIECHGTADTYKKGCERLERFLRKLSVNTTEDEQTTRCQTSVTPNLNDVPHFPDNTALYSSEAEAESTKEVGHPKSATAYDGNAIQSTSKQTNKGKLTKRPILYSSDSDSDEIASLYLPRKQKKYTTDPYHWSSGGREKTKRKAYITKSSGSSKHKIRERVVVSDSEFETPKKNQSTHWLNTETQQLKVAEVSRTDLFNDGKTKSLVGPKESTGEESGMKRLIKETISSEISDMKRSIIHEIRKLRTSFNECQSTLQNFIRNQGGELEVGKISNFEIGTKITLPCKDTEDFEIFNSHLKEKENFDKFTLRAITKFSAQDMQNRYILFNLGGIQRILLHVDNHELNIRRFALKALAQLCQLPCGPEQVLENSQNLRKIALMLPKVEDVFVLEFASLVLSELTREPLGCEQLVSTNILSSLFNRMKNCLDPDVQKNCLQTLSNLLEDPVCASEVTKNQQFSWPSLLALMQSQYLAIQHAAIKTVNQLICRYKDQVVQKTFKASTGVLDLCDILESYEFRDVHIQVLEVLRNYVETEENASHLYQSGCILRLLAYLEMALPAMKPHCLAVLTKMSYTANGRDALFETGTDLVFCQQLLSSNVELLADAAMGVANMTKLLPSAVRMSDTNVIEALCAILSDDAAIWFDIRMNALRALAELCRIIPKAAFSLVEPKTFAGLRNINRKFKDNPIEAQRLAVQCYINLQNYHVSTRPMLNADFMQELLNILQRIDISLKIMTCTVLCGLMHEQIAQELFTTRKGEEVVSENLRWEHVGLRSALCTLVTASVTDEGAEVYLDLGTIHYMVENKQARYVVGAWEPALEQIFRHHPSAKFAYTGRLDICDLTKEGFYVMKRLGKRFPTIEEVMSAKPPYKEPVYMCRFWPPPHDVASGLDIRTPYSETKMSLLQIRCALPDDPNLRAYLLKLKIWFGDPGKSLHYIEIEDAHYDVRYREKCAEVSSSLKQKARLLGEFVAEQMSGLDQERDCSLPSVGLHLADLMTELMSSIVGLGCVRVGGALERAVLYKALADRCGVPCALHRASSALAWCEVAVPELAPEDEALDKVESYPAGLLRVNYVVDLMKAPGRLIPRDAPEARRVCGAVCAEPYVAKEPHTLCMCSTKR